MKTEKAFAAAPWSEHWIEMTDRDLNYESEDTRNQSLAEQVCVLIFLVGIAVLVIGTGWSYKVYVHRT